VNLFHLAVENNVLRYTSPNSLKPLAIFIATPRHPVLLISYAISPVGRCCRRHLVVATLNPKPSGPGADADDDDDISTIPTLPLDAWYIQLRS
jgi:hypothetical protein